MFYKVIYNGNVVDVLEKLVFVKYNQKHKIMMLCSEDEAEAFLSSDADNAWHTEQQYNVPIDGYKTVELEEIDELEYQKLKMLGGKTPEEIIDAYTLFLIQEGVL